MVGFLLAVAAVLVTGAALVLASAAVDLARSPGPCSGGFERLLTAILVGYSALFAWQALMMSPFAAVVTVLVVAAVAWTGTSRAFVAATIRARA